MAAHRFDFPISKNLFTVSVFVSSSNDRPNDICKRHTEIRDIQKLGDGWETNICLTLNGD